MPPSLRCWRARSSSLSVKLKYLDGWNEARRRVAQRYNELLADLPVTTPYELSDVYHVYQMIYYPVPLHLQRLYADLGYGEGSLRASVTASREVLSLPMYPELTEAQQVAVARAMREFYSLAYARSE
jgi:dTDP-4-amino-4,6-dideoxygalactose transaminase